MKNILIFNDISGLGNCSMCANLPIFTKLGHYCMPVITATFSCQTGFVDFTCQKNGNLPQCVADITAHRKADVWYVGFCTDVNLLRQVSDSVKNATDAYIFVDPILGDNGALYSIFNQDYVREMKQLVKNARCISPNVTEACLLADIDYNSLVAHSNEPTFLAYCGKTFQNFLQITGVQNAVITGVECGDLIGNVVLQQGKDVRYVTSQRVPINFSGTGDTFSSVLLGELLNGCDLVQATEIAADFVCKAAMKTQCTDRRFGVEFGRVLNKL